VTAFNSVALYQLFIDLPFMLLFLYLIFYLGGYLVIVPIILSAIYCVVMIINSKFFFINRKIQIEAYDKLMAQLSETLEKIHLIKAAGLEEFQISKYRKVLSSNTEAGFRTNKFQMMPETFSAYFSQITLFSILIGGGYYMMSGGITFGEITACALLGGRAISPVQSLMNLYLQHNDIKLLKKRLDLIAAQPDQYAADTPVFPEDISGTIEIIDLNYHDVQNNRFEKISCQISSGSFVYINPIEFLSYRQLFQKIIGKERIEGGKILIDNLDITEWNMNSLKGKIEYLSDRVSLFKGSVMDNITYFNPSKNQEAYEAAAITGLDALVTQMSDGFETPLDSQASNYLSSAFMQRLNLTRALIDRPRILMIDRIDEGMDFETLEVFIWLLSKFKGKLTMVIATDNSLIKEMAQPILVGVREGDI
jgi:ATP-binding cassette subfamily C protein LapB